MASNNPWKGFEAMLPSAVRSEGQGAAGRCPARYQPRHRAKWAGQPCGCLAPAPPWAVEVLVENGAICDPAPPICPCQN